MNPLVTISIPLFKCENFLEKCLESAKNQTYRNIEIILVNDKTPDKSVEIAEQFISKHQLNNWHIVHLEKNSGLSVVRNKGIELALGKYIFFLDSDDTIASECIEKMVNLAESEKVQMVIGEVLGIRLPSMEKFDIFPILEKENVLRSNEDILKSYLLGGFPESSWNKLIRLDLIRENKLYFKAGLYAQDSLHTFQMMLKVSSLAILREKTYNYFLHKDSVIHNRERYHFLNWFTILKIITKEYFKAKKSVQSAILSYIISYQESTLQMNWNAKKSRELWIESYKNYKEIPRLSFFDYFSGNYSKSTKKKSFYISLPPNIGFRLFLYRYYRAFKIKDYPPA